MLLTRWRESSSSFVQHLWVSRCFLVAISVIFLTIRLESRGPCQKEVKKTPSNDGSPMAKARPCLVADDLRSEEISLQSLGSLVNPGNTDERKEVEIASGKSMRSASKSEIGYSQARQQKNVPIRAGKSMREDQLQTHSGERGDLLRQHQNWETAKRWCMSASDGTFSMQAYKTNVLIWRMFMSSSMQGALHLGPNYLTNLEIYKNAKFEEIDIRNMSVCSRQWRKLHTQPQENFSQVVASCGGLTAQDVRMRRHDHMTICGWSIRAVRPSCVLAREPDKGWRHWHNPPAEIPHRFGFAHHFVEAQEIMTIGSRRPALQEECIPLQLQPLKLTNTPTELRVYICFQRRFQILFRMFGNSNVPFLEQTLTRRSWWIFDCTLDSVLDREIEIKFDSRFQIQVQSEATALLSETWDFLHRPNHRHVHPTPLEHFSFVSNDPFEFLEQVTQRNRRQRFSIWLAHNQGKYFSRDERREHPNTRVHLQRHKTSLSKGSAHISHTADTHLLWIVAGIDLARMDTRRSWGRSCRRIGRSAGARWKCAGQPRCNVRHVARGMNCFGKMHTASCWALGHASAWNVSDGWLPDNTTWQTVRMRKCVRQGVLWTPTVAYTGIAISCKRKFSHLEF